MAAMAVLSTGSGQMARYLNSGCVLSRIRRLSAVKPSHFYQGLADLQLYQGRPAAVAVLSSLGGLLKLLTKLLIQLLFKLLAKLLLKLLIKLLLKLRIRSLDKVHKEDSAVR